MSSDIYSSSANASATRPPTNAYLMLRYEQPHRPLHLPRELARYLLRPENGSIIAINLDRLGLSGELKFSTLTGLTSLRNLTLSGNNFSGRSMEKRTEPPWYSGGFTFSDSSSESPPHDLTLPPFERPINPPGK
ncbi:hypothetical protein YC2023_119076 [Brassica napus]